jgi:lytic murein transglycosylase
MMRAVKAIFVGMTMASALAVSPALAATCGNNAAGFSSWVQEFKQEAAAAGVSKSVLDRSFAAIKYNTATIKADRGQHSFKLTFEQFMQKRGANAIISRGKTMKKNNAAMFASIERTYGVPAGPLLAIWGMETGFGGFLGNQHTLSAVATLSYDCRRSAFFTEQLYAALQLVSKGNLAINAKGAAHGEIGQTQFLPVNVIRYGVDADRNGHIDLVGSRMDALASTANFLVGHGWKAGQGYQVGEPNYVAIQGWNAASVYQQAIAKIGQAIDGR